MKRCYLDVFKMFFCNAGNYLFFKGCFVIVFLEIRTNIGPSDD